MSTERLIAGHTHLAAARKHLRDGEKERCAERCHEALSAIHGINCGEAERLRAALTRLREETKLEAKPKVETRACRRCGDEKPPNGFGVTRNGPNGVCKACQYKVRLETIAKRKAQAATRQPEAAKQAPPITEGDLHEAHQNGHLAGRRYERACRIRRERPIGGALLVAGLAALAARHFLRRR